MRMVGQEGARMLVFAIVTEPGFQILPSGLLTTCYLRKINSSLVKSQSWALVTCS